MTISIDTGSIEKVRSLVEKRVEQGEFSGVCLVKQGSNALVHDARGFAHRGFAIPNTTATRFDTASVGKIFTAVAALQLMEQGKLSLDTPVIPFLGLTGTTISDAVTIRHCLTHTSGIGDDADEEAGEDYELLFVDSPNYRIRETADFLPNFIHKPPVFAPGEGSRYNNVAFILVGLAIEKVSGLTYRDYIRQHVFDRAGMEGADYLAMDGINTHFAEHYKKITRDDGEVEWRKNIYSYPPIGSPADGATLTALDLDTYFRALRDGKLLGPEPTNLMHTPQAKDEDTTTGSSWYGFALQFRLDQAGRVIQYGKDGINAGVASQAVYYPDHDLSVILLANQDCNVWSLHRQIEDALFQPDVA
jgi:CubicO group peptidase (beta-lactamase class C family)